MNNIIEIIICIIIVLTGMLVMTNAEALSRILRQYYRTYPLTRLLTEEQLRSKPIYIEYAGATIIIAGIVSLIGVLRMLE